MPKQEPATRIGGDLPEGAAWLGAGPAPSTTNGEAAKPDALTDAQLLSVERQRVGLLSMALKSYVERYHGLRCSNGDIAAEAVVPHCARDLGGIQAQLQAMRPIADPVPTQRLEPAV